MRYKTYLLVAAVIVIGLVSTFTYFLLRTEEVRGILKANGQVRGTEVTVSSRIAGRLDILTVREGLTVKR